MISIDDLKANTTDALSLQKYLSDNTIEVYDFFETQKHSTLLNYKDDFKRYILLNWLLLKQLDRDNKTNLSFLTLLLEVCERLGLNAEFKLIYIFISHSDFDIGKRLKASSFYLLNVDTFDDYLNRYDSINELLQSAYENEEDSLDKVLMTMINYYAQVLIDFGRYNLKAVISLKEKIETTISENKYSFLKHTLVESILGIEIEDNEVAYHNIHFLLDSFLGRDKIKPKYIPDYLIESGTDYCEKLKDVALNFESIRQISVDYYNLIKDDSIFNSLQRGVKILTEESQLFAYMYSFGNMHFGKLNACFENFPESFFTKEINIIDWGCGQAMATMSYLDYLAKNNIEQICNSVTLIEPSELNIKRGSLHVKKYSDTMQVYTINKDLDALHVDDFNDIGNLPNLHLFSNILDIDHFSLVELVNNIKTCFKGINYFVCVSPYLNDLKTDRVDSFRRHFVNNEDYEKIIFINYKAGQWKNNWTVVMRIFKCTIV